MFTQFHPRSPNPAKNRQRVAKSLGSLDTLNPGSPTRAVFRVVGWNVTQATQESAEGRQIPRLSGYPQPGVPDTRGFRVVGWNVTQSTQESAEGRQVPRLSGYPQPGVPDTRGFRVVGWNVTQSSQESAEGRKPVLRFAAKRQLLIARCS